MASKRWLIGFLFGLNLGVATLAQATFHTWRINELYSNADGTIQFIEFHESAGADGQQLLAGHTLVTSQGASRTTFQFPSNLPGNATARRSFLVATQAFADLGVVAPDYIMPPGFLLTNGGMLNFANVDSVVYPALPTDGTQSVDRNGVPARNSPTNFAGASGTVGGVTVTPQTGWWWNPAESGRGFFIERQGSNLFMAGYLYAVDGRALWVTSGGPMTTSSHYQGELLTFNGGQTLTGAYHPPASSSPLGTIDLQFADAAHGTLTWPGGALPIERFDFAGLGGSPAANQPETGWWWNPAESGRGFSLEIQNNTLFIAGYMYDEAGNPLWYLSANTLASPTQYQGQWVQYSNGQTLSGPYQPPTVVNPNAGSLVLQFSDPRNGTLTLPDHRPIPITRFPF